MGLLTDLEAHEFLCGKRFAVFKLAASANFLLVILFLYFFIWCVTMGRNWVKSKGDRLDYLHPPLHETSSTSYEAM